MVTQGGGGHSVRGRRLRAAVMLGIAGLVLIGIAAGRGDAWASGGAAQPQTSVVVTTRSLPAASRLAPGDVTAERIAVSDVDASLAHVVSEVVGRRLLVPMPAHTPIERILVGPPDATAADAGRRTVRVDLPSAHVAPDVTAPADAEVVASTDTPSTGAGSRKVAVVAVCQVLQLDVVAAASATNGTLSGALTVATPSGPDLEAVLDCDAAAALRVVFAADFAHAVRLVAHPVGSPPPAAAGEGGP